MRKISVMLAVLLLVVCLGSVLPVHAATAMYATAKAGDPVIDGVARTSEYGEAFVLTGVNTVSWGGWTDLDSPVETVLHGPRKVFI